MCYLIWSLGEISVEGDSDSRRVAYVLEPGVTVALCLSQVCTSANTHSASSDRQCCCLVIVRCPAEECVHSLGCGLFLLQTMMTGALFYTMWHLHLTLTRQAYIVSRYINTAYKHAFPHWTSLQQEQVDCEQSFCGVAYIISAGACLLVFGKGALSLSVPVVKFTYASMPSCCCNTLLCAFEPATFFLELLERTSWQK